MGETVSTQAAGELRGMKKGDAAAAAERRMTDSGWLPEVLRNREVPERMTYGRWDDEENTNGDPDDEAEPESERETETLAESDQTGDRSIDCDAEEAEAA
ncbi:hypothetical protein [Paraburkholderia caribensis]|uniref:hypothetical protein n=1 Tax=Paraburkholderia caribensis TaxID=75105 RepID=UPI001CC6C4C6|nr:hypothetical protein [Paraburkholderia caribensis]